MIPWTLFYHPVDLAANGWTLWLVIPLCFSVAAIYKTLRAPLLRRIPLEVASLMGYILAGLVALALALWFTQLLL